MKTFPLHVRGSRLRISRAASATIAGTRERAIASSPPSRFCTAAVAMMVRGQRQFAPMRDLEVKRFDLMQQINARGTFVVTRASLPHLRESDHAHVLTLSPPLSADPRWLNGHSAYTLSKMGMTMITLGVAADEADAGISANCLWPRTIIATAAVQNLLGGDEAMARSRMPAIVADAAYEILRRDPRACTGNAFIDDEVLAEAAIVDLEPYAGNPDGELALDIFVDGWPAPAPPQ